MLKCKVLITKINMFTLTINPAPFVFTLLTAFGVLVHDTQIDQATSVALAMPGAYATYLVADTMLRSADGHTHVERATVPANLAALRATFPRLQPRDDDRRWQLTKRAYFGVGESGYIWPST